MNREEIIDVLDYKPIENDRIFVPNEIFNDFNEIGGGSSSKSFCFSFYYLIMYLYRFTKYKDRYYSIQDIKEILGYSRTNETMNKYVKPNGILEKMGYLSHTTDEPTYWLFNNSDKIPVFLYDSEFVNTQTEEQMKDYREKGAFVCKRNKSIKVPIKGLHRTKESLVQNNNDGVFFYIQNTTKITVNAFIFCMSQKDIGVEGFWVYSFIRYMNDFYGGDWNIPQTKMVQRIGISATKLNQILGSLESHNMITNSHENFVIGLPKDIKLDSCSYYALDSSKFNSMIRKTEKRTVMSFKTWSYLFGDEPFPYSDPFFDGT